VAVEVSVWYAGTVDRIIRCILLEETVNSNHCVMLNLTPFFRGATKDKKNVWLLHARQCRGPHSELLTDCPGRPIQEMANVSQIVAS
jgi:hypothetical protein